MALVVLVFQLLSLCACGDPDAAAPEPALSKAESYSWDSSLSPRGQDGNGHITVILYPDGRYEAVSEPEWARSHTYESGTWAAVENGVRFAPNPPTKYFQYRSEYTVPWKPGSYLGWVSNRQKLHTLEDIEGGQRNTFVLRTVLLPVAPLEKSRARFAGLDEELRDD